MGTKLTLAAICARLEVLEKNIFGHVRQRWSKRQLAEHEGISTREVMRRVKRRVYTPPEVENRRLYWWSDSYRLEPASVDSPELRAARNPALRRGAQTAPKI
jgi:hypothetical protein